MKLQVDNAEQKNLHFLRTLTHKEKMPLSLSNNFQTKESNKT